MGGNHLQTPQPLGQLQGAQVPSMDGKVAHGSLWTPIIPDQTMPLGVGALLTPRRPRTPCHQPIPRSKTQCQSQG